MNHTTLTILLLLGAGVAGGCPAKDRDTANEPEERGSAEQRRDEAKESVKKETKEATQAMRDYVYAERAVFVAEMKKDLAAAQADLDRLSAEVDQSSGEAKAKAKLELDAAREKWAQAKVRLDAAESATEDTWEDVKRGFKESHDELKESIAEARQWLSDEIEP